MDLLLKNFNLSHRDIFIYTSIDEESNKDLCNSINSIRLEDNNIIENNKIIINYLYKTNNIDYTSNIPDINIYLNTYGGSVYSGFDMYDTIKDLTNYCNVNIIVKGKCMSMGIPILLAVPYEHRFATASTTFMIHQVSSGSVGKCADLEEDVKESKRVNQMIFNIIKENTLISQEDLSKNYNTKADWYLTAKDALKLKLISKII